MAPRPITFFIPWVSSFIARHLGCFCFIVLFLFSSSKLPWNCCRFWKRMLKHFSRVEQWNFTHKASSIHVPIYFICFLLIYSFLQFWSNISMLVSTITKITFESSIFTIAYKYDRSMEVHGFYAMDLPTSLFKFGISQNF